MPMMGPPVVMANLELAIRRRRKAETAPILLLPGANVVPDLTMGPKTTTVVVGDRTKPSYIRTTVIGRFHKFSDPLAAIFSGRTYILAEDDFAERFQKLDPWVRAAIGHQLTVEHDLNLSRSIRLDFMKTCSFKGRDCKDPRLECSRDEKETLLIPLLSCIPIVSGSRPTPPTLATATPSITP